jgi:hypothetical protein
MLQALKRDLPSKETVKNVLDERTLPYLSVIADSKGETLPKDFTDLVQTNTFNPVVNIAGTIVLLRLEEVDGIVENLDTACKNFIKATAFICELEKKPILNPVINMRSKSDVVGVLLSFQTAIDFLHSKKVLKKVEKKNGKHRMLLTGLLLTASSVLLREVVDGNYLK